MLDRVPPPPLNSTSSLTVLNLTVESTSSFIGAVTMGAGATVASNLGVTGAVTITGVLTAQSSLAVSSATTLTGPVSLGGALSAVSGLSSLAGLNASATAVVSLTVSSAVTFSGLTKVLDQGDFIIQNQADTTKQLEFNLSGQTTGKLLTLSSLLTTSQVLQVPNITTTDTLPTLGLSQTFSAVNTFNNTTSATTSLLGAVVIGNGTAATSIGMGAGNINAGGTLTVGGNAVIAGTTQSGNIGIGTPALSNDAINISTTLSTGVNQFGIHIVATGSSSGTSSLVGASVAMTTAAAAYNCSQVFGYHYLNAGIGAGSSITSQYGYICDALSGATNNYAIYTVGAGLVLIQDTTNASSSTAGAVVIGNGTAATSVAFGGGNINAGGTGTFGGNIGVGGVAVASSVGVSLSGTLSGSTTPVGVLSAGTFGVASTNFSASFQASPTTAAAAFTATSVTGYYCKNLSVGAGSSVTTLYGVYIAALSGAGTNYAYYSAGAGLVKISDTTAATSSTAASAMFAGGVAINAGLWISSATMISTSTSFTNGAGSSAGTLTNAPAIGNPTKWIPINDNGTTRYIPAW